MKTGAHYELEAQQMSGKTDEFEATLQINVTRWYALAQINQRAIPS